ncbi:hypothetical protein Hanom_Chr07g00674951 [Helianthus anomalus]
MFFEGEKLYYDIQGLSCSSGQCLSKSVLETGETTYVDKICDSKLKFLEIGKPIIHLRRHNEQRIFSSSFFLSSAYHFRFLILIHSTLISSFAAIISSNFYSSEPPPSENHAFFSDLL